VQEFLQDFSWTQAALPATLQLRNQRLSDSEAPQAKPEAARGPGLRRAGVSGLRRVCAWGVSGAPVACRACGAAAAAGGSRGAVSVVSAHPPTHPPSHPPIHHTHPCKNPQARLERMVSFLPEKLTGGLA
jgi:hypothetical protein